MSRCSICQAPKVLCTCKDEAEIVGWDEVKKQYTGGRGSSVDDTKSSGQERESQNVKGVRPATNIKLILGDCLTEMQKIPDKSIDLVLTDPPYGISYQSNMRTQTEKFKVLENDNNDFRFQVYPIINQKLKDNSVCIVFCSYKNYAFDFIELSKFFDIKNCIVWDKGGAE